MYNSTAPTSIDWRKKGAVTPVKDQGKCGTNFLLSNVRRFNFPLIEYLFLTHYCINASGIYNCNNTAIMLSQFFKEDSVQGVIHSLVKEKK